MDDFYDAVNHDTLNGWEIPAEQADMSWFRKAREDNYSKVNDLIRQLHLKQDRQGRKREATCITYAPESDRPGPGDQGQGRIRPHSRSIFKGSRFSRFCL